MPTYEMPLLLRLMAREHVVSTLKRTAEAIFREGGVIRSLENLGTRDLPYKTSVHGMVHRKASYFVLRFDVPSSSVSILKEELGRDVDVVRRRVFTACTTQEGGCTLAEEMAPPAYRKDVQEMVSEGERTLKPKFAYNSGMDYYPFQK